ncbi:MAG: Trk system potassium transporter TrkA [Oscillospiraceae bacterium]|nr:Trk system potassium transporter TrkA [Oscillospiraceae bacterium]MDY6208374.1 Trk system potassium transporter TrkA [Oscillospiraceae bacterium]
MDIIIVGCGKVGQTLAVQLNNDGNNITVIDLSAAKVNEVISRHDIMGVVGNGATHLIQQEAGIEKADLLIAVTGSDELNLLCCLIAKKEGNCQTIARVRNPQYSREARFLKDELGLAMIINPEFASAAEIARILRFPSAIKIDTFAKGRVELIKFRLPEGSPIIDMAVKEVIARLKCDVLICTIERDGEAYIANGDFVFREKDVISVVASPRKANDFFNKIKYKMRSVRDVMIVGGGEITHYLADILLRSDIAVKVIEKDLKTCEEMCTTLPDVTVINGDAVEQELLLEEGLENTDGFVALTNLDEENILLSLFAKNKSKCKLITKINRIDFDEVVNQLDLDTIIYPKHLTAESIVRYVRAMKNTIGSNVETLYSVIKDKVEAAEFIVREKSPIVGIPLSELKFKNNVLVAAILRDRKVIIPRGHDVFMPGDAVVIVSEIMALHDITDVLKKG